jgi:spore maturation protein CgeB
MIDDNKVSNLFASATICPNISEPHANVFGFEVNERIFKLAASKAFFISDPIASLTEDIFVNDEAVIADNPEHFRDLVDTFLDKPHLRDTHIQECYDTVMSSHTYEHRANDIIQLLELDVCTKKS